MSRDDDGEYNEHDEEEQEAQEIGAAPVLLHATPDGSLQLTVPARRPVVRARHEVLDLVDVLLLRADERGDVWRQGNTIVGGAAFKDSIAKPAACL